MFLYPAIINKKDILQRTKKACIERGDEKFDQNLDKLTLFIVNKQQGNFKLQTEELPVFQNINFSCFCCSIKVHMSAFCTCVGIIWYQMVSK